ncbi:protein of unknown function [Candidatus Nitrosocaldus cavascurensis]|uniref:Transposase n=1 Tax=Candidatus Nitrosocaldus cavascurensis TaxID=2058097 RepID=A0A2K5AQ04_9ARCH|nr:protein of unknown function [Candidatus Nitrosocaldus cavascurensis]
MSRLLYESSYKCNNIPSDFHNKLSRHIVKIGIGKVKITLM